MGLKSNAGTIDKTYSSFIWAMPPKSNPNLVPTHENWIHNYPQSGKYTNLVCYG